MSRGTSFPIRALATRDPNRRWQPVRLFTVNKGGRSILSCKPAFTSINTTAFDASCYDTAAAC
ncbi:hypothetical protein [Sphingomonas sp. BK069]|uniref:hypothetical protein n=1 Tax=Sphingomonas sp. BK069 TaxID=2586979 RepID=UPI001606F9EB|nr:hypothetical protein [Sphingomonas sp. BK069]MBB3349592.1 hypothetical protein [Sphingomonas sp. BK069]